MRRAWVPDPECGCNYCQTGTRDGFGHDDGPREQTWLRDADDPEEFYDYVANYRASERRRHLAAVWIAVAAVFGMIIGLCILIFAVVE